VVHDRHAEDQVEALVLVREEQVWAQAIETHFRKVGAGALDQIFAGVDPDKPGLRRIEARRPTTRTGTHFQNVEWNLGGLLPLCGGESWLERRGLNPVQGLVEAWIMIGKAGFGGSG